MHAIKQTTERLYLTPADQGRPLTLDEFQRADSREGYRYELIEGKLEVTPLPNLPHDEVLDWLKDSLKDYAKVRPEVLRRIKGPARVFLPHHPRITVSGTDVAAYHDFPEDIPVEQLNWQDISPILVVEILSTDCADKDLVRNVDLYLQVASIREYWILDPRPDSWWPSLTAYRRRGGRWQRPIHLSARGTYTTPLLPGFTLVLDRRKPA